VSLASNKKRFIAGAKCPSCDQSDKLVLFLEEGFETFECVACGYKEQFDSNGQPRTVAKSEAVRFVDPGNQ
jgi:uncharacterized metal-binding protein (TIGR02443 family)